MANITRKEFLGQIGLGAAALIIPACLGACKKNNTTAPTTITADFTVNVNSGPLATNGGYIVQSGVIVARTSSGAFLAVAAACTHAGSTIQYSSSSNSFNCPSHGAKFDTTGNVVNGPATTALQKFNTSLSGTILHVYS
jgi:cytochrome b6-f complex iron-sulfur subunit